MPNKLDRHNVPFGNKEIMEEDMVKLLCGLLDREPRDFVEFINLHLLNGAFHLLTDTNKVWNEIQKDELGSILDPAGNTTSANSSQPNLQPFADAALYVIYKVADSKNVILEKEKVVKMVRGLAGYSISLIMSWRDVTQNSHERAALDMCAKFTLKRLEKLKDIHLKEKS